MKPVTRVITAGALSLAVAWTSSGCRIGSPIDRMAPALQGKGADVEVTLDGDRSILIGELLEIDVESFLLRVDGDVGVHGPVRSVVDPGGKRIVRVPWPGVIRATFVDTPGFLGTLNRYPPGVEELEKARQVSRFPYGIPAPVRRALLEQAGQEAEVVVGGRIGEDHDHDRNGASAPPTPPTASVPDHLRRFLDETRVQAERFHDQNEAIAHGYRLLGPDFPGMGEHWVHPGAVVGGEIDSSRPPVLTYSTVAGSPTLTGVAFAVPLGPGERPPDHPFPASVWHDHSAGLDEEALIIGSPASHLADSGGPRLAMVHVWLWAENPDGLLAQNNWTLPFLKAGIPVDGTSAAAGRAMSLAGEGRDYYRRLLRRAAPDERNVSTIEEAVGRAGRAVDLLLSDRRSHDLRLSELLEREWRTFLSDLEDGLTRQGWTAVRTTLGEH